ncbi:hypothetical protein [Leptolyngbya sp. ST-U4]|uniref:hypothetical protein n=1 Tax=Leptolyngbya sp. ST-U4 TaxID=2933912 RepID=UPI003296B91E
MHIVNSPNPQSTFVVTAYVLLLQAALGLAIAFIVGVIAVILSCVNAFFNWSIRWSVKQAFSLGGIMLVGTFLGLAASGIIGVALASAFAPTLYKNSGDTENPFGQGAYFLFILFVLWLPGWAIGGFWGGINSFLWYRHEQRQRWERYMDSLGH